MLTTLAGLLERLTPSTVAAEETFTDRADVRLYPAEEAAIARAVPKRRREFATVRSCARTALTRIGVAPAPIVPGHRGAPAWPAGVVGSMTHCAGYRACAVALAHDVITIGVDAEPAQRLPDGVLDVISLPAERAALAALAQQAPGIAWDRMLFSAKEAVYKAWFPLMRAPLDFSEATVDFDPVGRTFTARLLVPGPATPAGQLTEFSGRWLQARGLVLSAIVVPAPSVVAA
ncbi:4'-phosphopantetheinyl transferase family protein [Cryptosporangium arvum]|uniref:Phosphopantetheinyl transferase component of siderophore synthetase n=1 Tax=Cryptosporangium arvum DSM 44712 TaxID=927661 RepID=A0A010ZTX4_9ACTN|nr:4'-phosphopantetheinyl transferase superfamily protein [Cryptosporangium arvum]EXG82149.1 phosphopantetheinyl transferase component of siderophore synthetase [Cryptosporangium arvum DSM 44712]